MYNIKNNCSKHKAIIVIFGQNFWYNPRHRKNVKYV